jgi:sarcosine oxidase
MPHFDCIVLGTGGVGSAALYHLAKLGVRCLGLDRFEIAHERGSSHGQTRIIRQAYFEHPDYVPMLRRAYESWHELETECGESLLHSVGLVQIGQPDCEVLCGVRASAALHNLPIETLGAAQARRRFPGLVVPDDMQAIFEPIAGYLLVERCVAAYAAAAVRYGAHLKTGAAVKAWRTQTNGVQVETDRESFTADRLIITAGAWAGELLRELGLPLRVLRKEVYWWPAAQACYRATSGMPTFLYDLPEGCFYGFPAIDERGVKVAEHSGGTPVDDPLAVDRSQDNRDMQRVDDFTRTYLPQLRRPVSAHSVCLYTMTPDGHFIVDRHPDHPQVVFAAGLSGHGFKFAGMLGEALCQLALDGATKLPMTFLQYGRFRAK